MSHARGLRQPAAAFARYSLGLAKELFAPASARPESLEELETKTVAAGSMESEQQLVVAMQRQVAPRPA